MIYTLTLNPAIDYKLGIDRFSEGETNRTNTEEISFGGKGINVSAALKNLGADSVALGFVAGFTGDALCSALSDIGIKNDFIRLERGFTRINVKLTGGAESEINARGPEVSKSDMEALTSKLDLLCDGDILFLSGSIPRSVPSDIYSRIMERLSDKKIKIALDCEGETLLSALKYKPFVIKPNLRELENTLECRFDGIDSISFGAQRLHELGARNVMVSLGGDGAILFDENGVLHFQKAPEITVKGTVGAGDTMLAAFVYGYEAHNDHGYALRFGVAAGSATASLGRIADLDTVSRMLEKI